MSRPNPTRFTEVSKLGTKMFGEFRGFLIPVKVKMRWFTWVCKLCFSLIFLDIAVCLDDAVVGHLKPFGQHREPDVVTEQRETVPHPSGFWESYVSQNKPVVFRGAAKHSRYSKKIPQFIFS